MIQQHDISRQLERARRLLQEGDSSALKSLAEQYPTDPDIWIELSYAGRVRGTADAVTYAAKAQDLTPTDSRTHRALALALADEPDRLDEALDTMRRATTWTAATRSTGPCTARSSLAVSP